MQISKETELREKWAKRKLDDNDDFIENSVWWLIELSLILKEKVHTSEDYKKQLRNKVCDKRYDREIDMEINGVDRAIKILKQ